MLPIIYFNLINYKDTNIVGFNIFKKLIKPKIILIKLCYTKSYDSHISKFSFLKITQITSITHIYMLLCKIYILVV